MVAISACLAGEECRYNATDSFNKSLMDSVGEAYIDICPEILGGLPTPRPPCEIVGGEGKDVLAGRASIIDCYGNDVTLAMLSGADQALNICKSKQVKKTYLKQSSPTCGCGKIYDGSFSSVLKDGNGVFAELLLSHGIEVIAI